MRLIDKYRPQTLADIVGQPRALALLERIVTRADFAGDAFWIVGPSATGKTSTAWALARRFCADIDIVELDGDKCNVEAVREAAELMHYSTLTGGWRALIVNEAQAMTPRAVQAWLSALDRLPPRVLVIFTTTSDAEDLFGEFAGPFMSRCKQVAFTNQGLADAFAERAREIAQAEGLDGQPLAAYKKLVQQCRNNFRAVLQRIEAGELLAC